MELFALCRRRAGSQSQVVVGRWAELNRLPLPPSLRESRSCRHRKERGEGVDGRRVDGRAGLKWAGSSRSPPSYAECNRRFQNSSGSKDHRSDP